MLWPFLFDSDTCDMEEEDTFMRTLVMLSSSDTNENEYLGSIGYYLSKTLNIEPRIPKSFRCNPNLPYLRGPPNRISHWFLGFPFPRTMDASSVPLFHLNVQKLSHYEALASAAVSSVGVSFFSPLSDS